MEVIRYQSEGHERRARVMQSSKKEKCFCIGLNQEFPTIIVVDLYHTLFWLICYIFLFPDTLISLWPFVGEKFTHSLCLFINLHAEVWGKRLCYIFIQSLASPSRDSSLSLGCYKHRTSASVVHGSPLPFHLKVLLWSWLINCEPGSDKSVQSSHFNHFRARSKDCSCPTVLPVTLSQGQH